MRTPAQHPPHAHPMPTAAPGAARTGRSPRRSALPALALVASLALAGCTPAGDHGSDPDDAPGGATSAPTAGTASTQGEGTSAPEMQGPQEKVDRSALEAAVRKAKAGGKAFAPMSEETKAQLEAMLDQLEKAKSTPADCKGLAQEVLATNAPEEDAVAGLTEDSDHSLAVVSYDSPGQARGAYDTVDRALDRCASFTLDIDGRTAPFTVEARDVAVDGSQAARAAVITGDLSGEQTKTAAVWAVSGTALVSAENLSADDPQPAAEAAASLFAALD